MILLMLSILPALLWDEPPATAPDLKKAGIEHIAVTGVDYKAGVAGATAAPWINSNLWPMIRERERTFLYDVPAPALPLALAEAYAGGARTFFRVKPASLEQFAEPYRLLEELDGPPLADLTNFDLVDDRSPEMDEIMNLLVRR